MYVLKLMEPDRPMQVASFSSIKLLVDMVTIQLADLRTRNVTEFHLTIDPAEEVHESGPA